MKLQLPQIETAPSARIDPARVAAVNDADVARGRYVLYWMQQSQRADCNHALEYAVQQANALSLPVVVAFVLTDAYPQANLRHYTFMTQGLAHTAAELNARGIRMVVRKGDPAAVVENLAKNASVVVMDVGYLRIQQQWRAEAAARVSQRCVAVESDVIVPVEEASDAEAYSARVLRPKLQRLLGRFLVGLRRTRVKVDSLDLRVGGIDLSEAATMLRGLRIDRHVPAVEAFCGGTDEALRRLRTFVSEKLSRYHLDRGDPSLGVESHMSPYLHFGQISPLRVALTVLKAAAPREAKEAFLEELIVRRELSMNFVHYHRQYDRYDALPAWAQATLKHHAADRREVQYSARRLERGRTDDVYWNAAQTQMRLTGKMHNYMRMYWGKKIIEWTPDPRKAFAIALRLNNAWELDGRDANSFAGVAWCFGKHDRPWKNRAIFGTVRYMNAAGLERKFDMSAYVRQVEALRDSIESPGR